MDRFFSKVRKIPGGCWLWTGATSKGYGQIGANSKVVSAHRFSYEMHVGPIPEGFLIMHTCDTPRCVNPDHLLVGTQSDNMRDMIAKSRGGPPRYSGESHPTAKLTADQVDEIRSRYKDGEFQKSLVSEFGVSQAQISRIVNGKRWDS